jgi:hypothetical protein
MCYLFSIYCCQSVARFLVVENYDSLPPLWYYMGFLLFLFISLFLYFCEQREPILITP